MSPPGAINKVPETKTDALYQKNGTLHTHTTTLSSITPLATFPPEIQALYQKPTVKSEAEIPQKSPYVLTFPETIFHAQGGGQPSDTGTITLHPSSQDSSTPPSTEQGKDEEAPTFHVHSVRKASLAILHIGTFNPPSSPSLFTTSPSSPPRQITQSLNIPSRTLHSRLHTGGHVLSLAIRFLSTSSPSTLPPSLKEVKASHYPGAAFVEFQGLIPGTAKGDIQAQVDKFVAHDLDVKVHFWTPEEAAEKCAMVGEGIKGGEEGVRVVEIGDVGSYPCGGTHVLRLSELGRVVVRNIKRQKGVSKVSYEVVDV
ncbi:ThrRS/AlaRS common domain-containing protein [Amniculicola lignicola CBS 123094]|uniref:ThrRS/AlaRS common domain-containing protein n=1 Tax=Amniculicola lignicola CBS 123094 TaxID=1392246 RepID=A0A6A5WL07_9PLEO|nr:ThrRS/AlaRS common domain-containing protein [Amniculicola lignicola CBS 123094]